MKNDVSLPALVWKILAAQKAEALSPEEVAALQEKRFRKLLRYAVCNSKFYRRLYREHGITEGNIDSVVAEDIPIIDKKILMEHFDDLVSDPALKQKDLEAFILDPKQYGEKYLDRFQVIHTSGSTGRIGLFTYSLDEWAEAKALAVARVSKGPASFFRKTRLAFIGATDGQYAGVSLAIDAPKFLFDILPVSINDELSEIVREMNDFHPDVLGGYASGLSILAQEKLRGNLTISPKRIIAAADVLTEEMRKTIREAFGVEPINFYAASEALCMGAECDEEHSFHLFTDWHRFELFDQDGKAVSPGGPGTLVLTNLYNYTEPLIRYRMNDELVIGKEACACGSPFPVLEHIAGRSEDFLWFKNERGERDYLHPLLLDFFIPGLKRAQFVQVEGNALVMKAVMEKKDRTRIIGDITAHVMEVLKEKKFDRSVTFSVEEVENIPNDPKTGKFKLVIPLKK